MDKSSKVNASILAKKGNTNPYSPASPLNHRNNHTALLAHINERMDASKSQTDKLRGICLNIDQSFSGHIQLDEEDRRRQESNRKGKAPKIVNARLQTVKKQLRETKDFLLEVFAPDVNIFEAVAPQKKMAKAKAIAAELSKQGKRGQYYREYSLGFARILKYPFAGFYVNWADELGNKIGTTSSGLAQVQQEEIIWSGNRLVALDMYNFFWDNSVMPVELPTKGEWFATSMQITPFRARQLERAKSLFDVDRFINISMNSDQVDRTAYFTAPPKFRDGETTGSGGWKGWDDFLGATSGQVGVPLEVVDFYGWMNGTEFGLETNLDPKDKKENWGIYHIRMVNGSHIAFHRKLTNAHGMLPIGIASLEEDINALDDKTRAEELIPYQDMASFLFNIQQASLRKAVFGLTLYDPKVFPGLDHGVEELRSGMIPAKRGSSAKEAIRDAFHQINHSPETSSVFDTWSLMEKLAKEQLPVDRLNQVTDIDRAVEFQVVEAMQSAKRPLRALARQIQEQCLGPIRLQMVYNLFQYGQQIPFTTTGGVEEFVSPSEFLDEDLEYFLGEGMQGVDRNAMSNFMLGLLNRMLQSKEFMQEYDLVAFMDYITSLLGDYTDLTQFRRENTQPQTPPNAPAVEPTLNEQV